jgi:hypothetical protein
MRKRLPLASAALSLVGLTESALADGAYVPPPPAVLAEPFRWTGCYGGLHVGGAWASRDLTDPVQLVQDQISGAPVTTGVTTVTTDPSGWLLGGQIGCDYQFASHWVIGIEAAASATTLKGGSNLVLPLGNPGEREGDAARGYLRAQIVEGVGSRRATAGFSGMGVNAPRVAATSHPAGERAKQRRVERQ